MAMLNEGSQAPDFSVVNQNGDKVSLSDYRGRNVVLWWYPKADTPG
jgi:peroxiredoxin Q/BCP